jgi:NADH-quinone oxidoreductase subunit L
MLVPMAVLAAGSLVLGYLLILGGSLQHFLTPSVGPSLEVGAHTISPVVLSVITLAVVAGGVASAWWLIGRKPVPAEQPPSIRPYAHATRRSLTGDAINESIFMRPGQYFTRALVFFDNRGVDGIVNGFAAGVGGTSARIRRMQTGFVRSYALSMLAGALAIGTTIVLLRVGS